MDRQNMVYSYTAWPRLFSNKKELTTDTCYKGIKNIMLSEKSRQKRWCIVWFHLYKIPNESKSVKVESRLVAAWGRWELGLIVNQHERSY